MTPAEKQAFDLMREALKHGIKWMNIFDKPRECLPLHAALAAAADAVAEQQPPLEIVGHYAGPKYQPGKTGAFYAGWDCQLPEGTTLYAAKGERNAIDPDGKEITKDLAQIFTAAEQGQAVMIPEDVIKAAKIMRDGDYRGPLFMAKKVFDWVAAQPSSHTMTTPATPAERMAGARAKHDDTYPSDLLARMENEPK